MANIAIILRTEVAVNRFQQAIVSAIAFPSFDKALLCSGFFQEGGKGKYYASDTLVRGLVRPTPMELTAIGTYSPLWLGPFHDFVSGVCSKASPHYLNIKKRKANRWHAKVFIAWESGAPAFAVIGSSNITRPAFDKSSPFNFECDVIIWNTSCAGAVAFAERQFGNVKADDGIIFANYEENGRNGPLSVSDRLAFLAAQIIKESKEIA